VLSAKLILASGSTVSTSLPSIPANGHAAFELPSQFPQSAGQQGTLELSSAPVIVSPAAVRPNVVVLLPPTFSAIALRFNPTGAFTSLPVYVLSTVLF